MKTLICNVKRLIVLIPFVCAGINSNATTISQVPIFLATGAEPNVMFILDDSSSMLSEVMPEFYMPSGTAMYMFPWVSNIYGTEPTGITSVVASQDSGKVYHKLVRSKVNTIYYNPAIEYKPWVKTDLSGRMDDANPECAFHNPIKTDGSLTTGTTEAACRNLTVEVTSNQLRFNGVTRSARACTGVNSNFISASGCSTDSAKNYYPATYYYFSGDTTSQSATGGVWDSTKYLKVEIKSTTASYSGDGRTKDTRPDCVTNIEPFSCTYKEEMQNFANWYTYYRSRILLARGAIATAFYEQDENIRVGYGAINKASSSVDGVNASTIINGVRKFTGAEKTKFIEELYKGRIPYGSGSDGYTPLRRALDDAGKYYSRKDNRGPWGKNPGTNDSSTQASCRASNTILITDGYWNNWTAFSNSSITNIDGSDGSEISNDRETYTYKAALPFTDDASATLADIAMYYWRRDLNDDIDNNVNTNSVDNAFWQHMRTFTIGLGVNGTIPYPFDNGSALSSVQDILRDKTGVLLPKEFAWPSPIKADLNTGIREKIDDLLHAAVNGHGDFFSATDPDAMANQLKLVLKDISSSGKGNAAAAAANSTNLSTESVLFKAQFDSDNWTGKLQAVSIGKDGKVSKELNAAGDLVDVILWESSIPAANSRKIFSSVNSAGIELSWDKLSGEQKTIFQNGGDEAAGQKLLNWFKGATIAGLRARTNLLGDIVNSDPAYAGSENYQYEKLNAALGGTAYKDFYTKYKYSIDPESKAIKQRTPMIYVGANDGMLHGFNASTGVEVFAYAPSTLFSKIPDLAKTNYNNAHQYYVDGPVYINDAYIDGEWKTILVGSLGAGGRTIFALDITDPDNFSKEDVLFEIDEGDYKELGNTLGTAIIAPGSDNRWKIFVGNGYNSDKGDDESAYLGVIDIEDEYKGSRSAMFIKAGNNTVNGLAQPALLPNASGQIIAAFAGDLHGNMWKFDLSSSDSDNWKVAYSGKPLFVAKDSGGVTQEITSSPTLGFNLQKSPAALMVYFGTGKYMATADISDTQTQSFYGVVDKDYTTALVRADMFEKTFDDISKRSLNSEVVDWTAFDGWYLDFTGGDRVITKPVLVAGNLIFPTLLPNDDPCKSGGTGWLMELKGVGDKGCLLCDAVELVEPIIGDLILLKGYDESKNELNVFVGEDTEGELQAEVTTDENAGLGRHSWRQLQ